MRLSFGLNVDWERIVEGSAVYMDCLVQARPKPYKVCIVKSQLNESLHATTTFVVVFDLIFLQHFFDKYS